MKLFVVVVALVAMQACSSLNFAFSADSMKYCKRFCTSLNTNYSFESNNCTCVEKLKNEDLRL